MGKNPPANQEIADTLGRIADLLEMQHANPHRVRAYRNGARRVRSLPKPLSEIVKSGEGDALRELPDIGEGLSRVITNIVHSGRSAYLDRLQGEVSPEELFSQVPGIGQKLSKRIANQLDINTLEALERAAHDGRLSTVEGFGEKRVRAVQISLAGMLSRAAQQRARRRAGERGEETQKHPGVGVLLEMDSKYRRKARAGELTRIAPRRFNPKGEAWLPIMHASQNGWDFTVLYSNTARAHELGKTHDWVVMYYERDDREDQATVVTVAHGPLAGKRVVRGREAECERFYEQ